MLNKIIQFALHNRLIVLLGAGLLLGVGLYTANTMDVDVFPDLNAPTVVVLTEANGMAAEEVEQLVTFPIETAVNGAAGIRRVRSSSTTGFSVVWVEFEWGTEIYRARQIITEKLAGLNNSFPTGVGMPTLAPQSSIMGEVMTIGITADSTSMLDLRTLADWTVRPRLLSTGGVAQVTVIGGDIKEFQILLNPGKMKHYDVSLDEVDAVVENMNQNAAGGSLYEYGSEYIVRGMLQTNEIEKLGKALVKKRGEAVISLADIAEIKIGGKAPKLGMASEKGKPAVLLTVTKQPSVSTIELSAKIDEQIKEIQEMVPSDVKISTDIFRQEQFINNSIGNVQKSLYEGAIFVVIVLVLFLMNGRTTFISLVTLPLSLCAALLILKAMGLTINTMSLGGLAISIGSLVDDAIIDVENVYKHIRQNRLLPRDERKPILDVVFEASKEVRMPILNSTLIIIASFVPLFFLSGMEGRMLVPLGIAFIAALVASTIIALTVTPVLCSYLLKSDKKQHKESAFARWLKNGYEKSLGWTLRHQKPVLICTVALFVVAVVAATGFGRNFLPPFNEGSFTLTLNTMPGISLDESGKLALQAEMALLTIDEVQTVGRKTGRAELDEHSLGVNTSELEVPFKLGKRTKDEVANEIREKLNAIPGVTVEIGQPISHRLDHMLSGTKANIAIKIFGSDLDKLYLLGNQIKASIEDIDGIADLTVEQLIQRPQLKIEPKRDLMAKYGITMPQFAAFVNTMLGGEVVSQVYDNGRTFDLTLKVSDEYKDQADKIRNLTVDANGMKIPLEYIANVRSAAGPNTINRENVQRKIVVSANVSGRDLRGVVNDIQKTVKSEIQLPQNYRIEYGGQFESEQAASRTLIVASIFAILVIFLLIYNQFKDIKTSIVILLNLLLAFIGGIFAVFFTSNELSIPALIGFISLFGIATRNGILLVSHYDDLKNQNFGLTRRVLVGSLDRLNPILMTALATGLALIPLAVQGGLPGNEIQSPMAKVILGGLLSSTLLNMYIVPIAYGWIHKNEKGKAITTPTDGKV